MMAGQPGRGAPASSSGAGSPGGEAGGDEAGATRARAFGHGKVILFGEHAVVYGQPALAAGLSLGLSASVVGAASGDSDGAARLSVPGWGLAARAGDGTPVGQAFAAILGRLRGASGGGAAPDPHVRVDGDLPPRAGLGSSAAMSIAIARAIAAARGLPDDLAAAAAGEAENVFHGSPSGIDLAVASSGAVGRFQRGVGWQPIPVLQAITLCVGLSGRPRDTRAQVDAVRRLRERTAVVNQVIQALGDLTPAGERALAIGDVDELGRLFDVAHGLLAALRVSSAEIEALVHAARAAGAVGAKLTGAGGGGAVIALAPGHEADVLARWRAAGYTGFLATVGAGADTRAIDHAGATRRVAAAHEAVRAAHETDRGAHAPPKQRADAGKAERAPESRADARTEDDADASRDRARADSHVDVDVEARVHANGRAPKASTAAPPPSLARRLNT